MTIDEPEPPLTVESEVQQQLPPEECPHLRMHGDHMWIDGVCMDCGLKEPMHDKT